MKSVFVKGLIEYTVYIFCWSKKKTALVKTCFNQYIVIDEDNFSFFFLFHFFPLWAGPPPCSRAHLPKSRLIDQQASGIPDEDNPGGSPPLTTHTKRGKNTKIQTGTKYQKCWKSKVIVNSSQQSNTKWCQMSYDCRLQDLPVIKILYKSGYMHCFPLHEDILRSWILL